MACDLRSYTDFEATFDANLAADVPHASDVVLAVESSLGNRLHIVTGTVIIDFRPTDDQVLRKGTVRVWLNILDFPDEPFVGIVSATANAGLSSIFNNDSSQNTTWAVDCVEVVTGTEGTGRLRPQLVAAVAVAGGGGTAGLSRMNYQANVLLQVPGPQLVSLGLSDLAGFPPNFGPVATVFAGQGWQGLITLSDVPLSPGVLVQLSIPPGDQQWVALPNPPAHEVFASNQFTIFTAPRTTAFTTAEHSEIDVPVTATLAGTSRTAILRILGTPG